MDKKFKKLEKEVDEFDRAESGFLDSLKKEYNIQQSPTRIKLTYDEHFDPQKPDSEPYINGRHSVHTVDSRYIGDQAAVEKGTVKKNLRSKDFKAKATMTTDPVCNTTYIDLHIQRANSRKQGINKSNTTTRRSRGKQ